VNAENAAGGNVLVVDDEEGIRAFLADALRDAGHTVTAVPDGLAAVAEMARKAFHVVVTDLMMPNMDGRALLAEVRRTHPDIEVIVLTAHGSIGSAVEAMKQGAFDYLEKPVESPGALRLAVSRALERHRLRAAQEVARPAAEPPLGYGSPAMAALEQTLRKVAATNATVLLLGDSGSGKEVAARAVHRWSPRAAQPFVAVNCAALSSELLESELFGHEKGAFTGAYARKRGRIELAEGGTFFLDEVGELTAGLQAKLLRVLQEKRFERVGGQQTVEADVRWIAATNRNLPEMMEKGAFREDLYHRLAVFPVRVPALRDRREDIGPLAEYLLGRIAVNLGNPTLTLSQDARAALTSATWPGNVRELANVLERSAIMAEGSEIRASDLAWLLDAAVDAAAVPTTVSEIERDAILRALAATDGNRRRAAARLGIGLRTLYDKLKRYGIG
jgi:two-component system, NtrC family, response regulator AtoC